MPQTESSVEHRLRRNKTTWRRCIWRRLERGLPRPAPDFAPGARARKLNSPELQDSISAQSWSGHHW